MAGVRGWAMPPRRYDLFAISAHVGPLNKLATATCPAILDGDGRLVLAARAIATAARHPYFTGLLAALATAAVAGLKVANLLLVATSAIAARATNHPPRQGAAHLSSPLAIRDRSYGRERSGLISPLEIKLGHATVDSHAHQSVT